MRIKERLGFEAYQRYLEFFELFYKGLRREKSALELTENEGICGGLEEIGFQRGNDG